MKSLTLFRGTLIKRKHAVEAEEIPDNEVEIGYAHGKCEQYARDETRVDGHNTVDEVRGEVSEGECRQDRHDHLEHHNEVIVELLY